MAQQIIDLGTVANDGTGDDLRTGGDKINDNFTELYGIVGPVAGGIQAIPILAAAMVPNTTNGPAASTTESTTNDVMLSTLDFDQSTQESAQFPFPMPKRWDELTVTAQFIWTAAAGTPGDDVIWGLAGLSLSDSDALDTAFGTGGEVTDTLLATGDLHQSAWTSPITIGASPAEGDVVFFKVYRKAADGGDDLAADAKLIGIRLAITTNAADDS